MSLRRPIYGTNNGSETLEFYKRFNLSHNDLGHDFEEDTDGKSVRTFTSLQAINIDFNEIISRPKHFINASGNILSSWILNIQTESNLTFLDLSENKLPT